MHIWAQYDRGLRARPHPASMRHAIRLGPHWEAGPGSAR